MKGYKENRDQRTKIHILRNPVATWCGTFISKYKELRPLVTNEREKVTCANCDRNIRAALKNQPRWEAGTWV